MIRHGMLCKSCTSRTCRDIGTEAEPIEIDCPECKGEGCEHCVSGCFTIEGCPNKFCSEIVPLITLSDLFEKGIPPIAGGALDQAAWFLEACRVLRSDEAELGASKDVN